jgi:hypothetical protein
VCVCVCDVLPMKLILITFTNINGLIQFMCIVSYDGIIIVNKGTTNLRIMTILQL